MHFFALQLMLQTDKHSSIDGQKHRVINYYRPNDVIEMCHRDANGIEAADGEEVFQKPSKVATLKEAIVSKELNLNQLLKGQNLHEESTSKSFRIISESPESEGPPDDQDTPRQKRQKQEGSILHMAQEGVGTYHSQTPPAHENPPRQSSQPPKFLIPFQPPNSQANENSLANSNSFYPRPVNYPCPPPPHMMQRPPSMQHYPLNQSPTNESFQPRPAYHQQQQPEESPVVYNLPAGASWSNLMPPPNYVYPTPPVPSYFHRLQHPPYHPAPWSMSIQHLYVPSPDPYGSYPNHLPNQSSLPEYPPPHSYSAPPPHPYPGYTGMIPASMHVQAAGQRHQQHPSYYMGPPQPELPSLPQDPAGDGDGHPIL
ncbi:hypothetical protein BC830DRAFT_101242 [Chytriomyces sp. MP71]|nr:hypothetical protein BC830DRAFT_101242 [Chytriomyces sp. MP71]